MSNMMTLQKLELLEGWKSWKWEITEVPLYYNNMQYDYTGLSRTSC